MAPPNRTYSDFFSSGLRAMAGSSYRRPFSGRSSSENLLKISTRNNALRNLTRRQRASSSPTPASMPPETTAISTRRRRSSIIDLPSRLLERFSKLPDGWTPPAEDYDIPNSYKNEKRAIIDSFDASPNSTSFPVDSIEPSLIQRPQSFLFLGDSTESVFRLRLPFQHEHQSTSVRSMPPPSPSRCSSLPCSPPLCDKYDDHSWELGPEEESIWIDEILEDDPAATIDWRQFHNDLLNSE